jgi:hypothetical protein
VVEHQLPKLIVEGSIPFARSNFLHVTEGPRITVTGSLRNAM